MWSFYLKFKKFMREEPRKVLECKVKLCFNPLKTNHS